MFFLVVFLVFVGVVGWVESDDDRMKIKMKKMIKNKQKEGEEEKKKKKKKKKVKAKGEMRRRRRKGKIAGPKKATETITILWILDLRITETQTNLRTAYCRT